jgi:hypothetical protein
MSPERMRRLFPRANDPEYIRIRKQPTPEGCGLCRSQG